MEVIPGQFESKVGFCLKKPSVVPWKYFAKLLACLGVLLRGLVFQNYCVIVIQAAIVKIRSFFLFRHLSYLEWLLEVILARLGECWDPK